MPRYTPAPLTPDTANTPVLSVTNLRKEYGPTVAVEQVSFEVRPGEIVGLLGRNGAGKTTTINMILGVLAPTAGSIHIRGVNLATDRTTALTHTNFTAVYAPLPGNLTVEQNLRVFGLMYDVRPIGPRVEKLMEEFDLLALRHAKCGVLSSGEQTRVGLAKAMLNRPALLLLDEPTASLDPATARDIRARIRRFVTGDGGGGEGGETGGARVGGVLWTSHNMYEVQEVCDRVLFLSRGKVLLGGDPRTLPAEHGASSLDDLFIAVANESLTIEPADAHAITRAGMTA